jgi:hypothetical protein
VLTSFFFAAGSFIGMLALSLVARAFHVRLGEPGEDVVRHVITMVLGGLFIGAAIGLLSARLALPAPIRQAPAHSPPLASCGT